MTTTLESVPDVQPRLEHRKEQSSRLTCIDFLRGFAATAVLLGHAWGHGQALNIEATWFRYLFKIFQQGGLGVPLFFVISGFCIHLRGAKEFARTGEDRVSFLTFWKRRVRRLYPPYLVMLCLSMAAVLVGYLIGVDFQLVVYPGNPAYWMPIDFVAHVFMLHGFHPTLDFGGGNSVYWTLAREEYLYLMYFLVLYKWRSLGAFKSLAIICFLGVVVPRIAPPIAQALFGPADWNTYLFFINKTQSALALWIQWCLGMAAVDAYYGNLRLPKWCYWIWLVPFWAILGYKAVSRADGLFSAFFWGMAFFTIVNYCVQLEQNGKFPRNRIFRWLSGVGIFSYSLYLVHFPLVKLMSYGFETWAPRYGISVLNPYFHVACSLIILLVCYYASKGFFILVENRFIEKPSSEVAPQGTTVSTASA